MQIKKYRSIAVLWAAGVLWCLGNFQTHAFFTGYDEKNNTITVGYNESEIIEDFPVPSSIPVKDNPSYRKTVQISNVNRTFGGAAVDCYTRVMLSYSDADIGKAVKLLGKDTQNWVYNAQDGYYYYVSVLRAGERTTPLFTGLQINGADVEELYGDRISDFRLQIYEETVQAVNFNNYEDAWRYYLNPVNSI